MGSFRSSNGVWRRKKPFGLFRFFLRENDEMRSFDYLEWILIFQGEGDFFSFWVHNWTEYGFFFLFCWIFLFLTTDYYFIHLLFSQVSNPPFGESLLDCSLKGLEDHRQIGRRNVCQLFSGWYFCHNST